MCMICCNVCMIFVIQICVYGFALCVYVFSHVSVCLSCMHVLFMLFYCCCMRVLVCEYMR